ncbi:hypothetical protein CPB83DRAFT_850398 [Crepidotus variabilis]|uniref:Uncharacterized protein n=1 Tax=Crepidotus variabilis TaxID=179855 RepID=A0A9P6JSJ4_9AGAR|nr:hypothetical protein CPB83DRAFT_850398 [Crepidotus variabilis]
MAIPTDTVAAAPPLPSSPTPSQTAKNLPPTRSEKGKPALRSVKPPMHSLSFNRFIYGLVLISLLGATFYTWRLMAYKTEVGGWWKLITGVRKPPQGATASAGTQSNTGSAGWKGKKTNPDCHNPVGSVEHHITALAGALGMPTPDLTRAIALAVRQYVPPASLASLAAKERETGASNGKKGTEGSEIMRILMSDDLTGGDVREDATGRPMHIPTPPEDEHAEGSILGNVVGGVESFVGMDEP